MKKIYKFSIILYEILTAVALVSCIISFVCGISNNSPYLVAISLADIVCILLTVFYTAVGYKKPHGNLLKYLLLIFAVLMMTRVFIAAAEGIIIDFVLNMFAIICIAYVAGRLNRIEQNKYLMSFIALLIIAVRVYYAIWGVALPGFIFQIAGCAYIIIWLDLCCTYFLRYKQHREAGLADAPKK